jgi:hypothetical protein
MASDVGDARFRTLVSDMMERNDRHTVRRYLAIEPAEDGACPSSMSSIMNIDSVVEVQQQKAAIFNPHGPSGHLHEP